MKGLFVDTGGWMAFRYRDKRFSFTDCTSFVVMQELKIARALSTDAHFRQMGFQAVPGAVKSRGRS